MYDESYFDFTEEELEEQREGIEKALDIMKQRCINSIHFAPTDGPQEESVMTYYGDRPYVPTDFEWPYYEGKNCFDEMKNRPMCFIAQFDCHDLQPYDKEHVLPESGILSFFYELASSWHDAEGLNSEQVRVYHFDSSNDLHIAEFPEDLDEGYRLSKRYLKFISLMDTEKHGEDHYGWYGLCINEVINNAQRGITDPCDPNWYGLDDLWFHPRDFPELMGEAKSIFSGGPGGIHLLGYPDFFQGDEFEAVAPEEWRLLLQIDSYDFEEPKLKNATENGVIFFALPTEDLLRHKYDRVAGTVQFS